MSLKCPRCSAAAFWAARTNQVIAERVRWFLPRPFVCSSCCAKLKRHPLQFLVWLSALLPLIGGVLVFAQPISQALGVSKETLAVLITVVLGALYLAVEALFGYGEA